VARIIIDDVQLLLDEAAIKVEKILTQLGYTSNEVSLIEIFQDGTEAVLDPHVNLRHVNGRMFRVEFISNLVCA
jgi:hypothetical protein